MSYNQMGVWGLRPQRGPGAAPLALPWPCGEQMPVLETAIDVRGEGYRANFDAMQALVSDLRGLAGRVREGGPEAARAKHLARGKLLPRDRVRALIDPGGAGRIRWKVSAALES